MVNISEEFKDSLNIVEAVETIVKADPEYQSEQYKNVFADWALRNSSVECLHKIRRESKEATKDFTKSCGILALFVGISITGSLFPDKISENVAFIIPQYSIIFFYLLNFGSAIRHKIREFQYEKFLHRVEKAIFVLNRRQRPNV